MYGGMIMRLGINGLTHDHVDGSMAVKGIIGELYRMAGKDFPFASAEEWRVFMCDSRVSIPERFDTITSVLQTNDALDLLGYAYGAHRAREGYMYVEGKFAPQYHTREWLTMRGATAAIIKGLRRAEDETGIRIFPVVCIGREATPETGVEIARIALGYGGEVGLDLVCDEAGNPPEKHLPAYASTFGSNVRRDCHVGEWVEAEPAATYLQRLRKNIWTAVTELKCHGIGHAIPLGGNEELMNVIAGEGVRVSGCPLSNKTLGWVKDLRELCIDQVLDRGICYTLNPDDDLFLPTMEETVRECDRVYAFSPAHRKALQENVFKGAFDPRMRDNWRKFVK
ncbi:MAG: hypothetical protein HYV25_01600 [Candidatus Harrisonbacteria bacterium]|nr:hypothetical protein [Candidatus Harrisonbacteria bacterium]